MAPEQGEAAGRRHLGLRRAGLLPGLEFVSSCVTLQIEGSVDRLERPLVGYDAIAHAAAGRQVPLQIQLGRRRARVGSRSRGQARACVDRMGQGERDRGVAGPGDGPDEGKTEITQPTNVDAVPGAEDVERMSDVILAARAADAQ
jgi:hypothetical protein